MQSLEEKFKLLWGRKEKRVKRKKGEREHACHSEARSQRGAYRRAGRSGRPETHSEPENKAVLLKVVCHTYTVNTHMLAWPSEESFSLPRTSSKTL